MYIHIHVEWLKANVLSGRHALGLLHTDSDRQISLWPKVDGDGFFLPCSLLSLPCIQSTIVLVMDPSRHKFRGHIKLFKCYYDSGSYELGF